MKRAILAFLCALIVATATAQAGTTGVVDGSVTDDNGAPVSAVKVVAISPSDRGETTTDASGRFELLRLAPDSYVLSMEKSGYEPVSYAGVTVFADNTLALSFKLPQIQRLVSRHPMYYHSEFIKPGVGADVWNVSDFGNLTYPLSFYLTAIPGLKFGSGCPIPH